ncbi:MAG: hypothetical protein KatS3mg081_1631 [Gemmatimonadales bacterium]|nr:MAG: hypothetical protein KatS3mg081_1631 [Gemmatimonadales bacterium]
MTFERFAVVRVPFPFTLFTLDHRLLRGQLGRLSVADEARVRQALVKLLGLEGQERPRRKPRSAAAR